MHSYLLWTYFFAIALCKLGATGGGISGPCPPKSLLDPSPPMRKMCTLSKGCASKERCNPGATGLLFGACAPQNTACAPPP